MFQLFRKANKKLKLRSQLQTCVNSNDIQRNSHLIIITFQANGKKRHTVSLLTEVTIKC